MAMSAKNAENPVTPIRPICLIHPLTGTSRRVFLGERKWVSITRQEIAAPRQVAMPAPMIPKSRTKTKK